MSRLVFIFTLVAMAFFCHDVNAESEEKITGEHIITISLGSDNPGIGSRAKRKLDSLVRGLVEQGDGKLLVIEGFCSHGASRLERARKSYYFAKQVENYLRTQHKLNLNIHIAAAKTGQAGINDFVRITLYPDRFTSIYVSSVGNADMQ